MNAKEQTRIFVDGIFVVGDARAVGGADFAKHCAALFHDFRDAETIADFDQFAARDDDFAAPRESGKSKQNGGGTVVDDDGCFGPGHSLD